MHVGLGPALRPHVIVVKLRERMPVRQRALRRVLHFRAPLLRAADDENPAEALLREAAEILRDVAIEQRHRIVALDQLQRRANPREPAADDDDVTLAHVIHSSVLSFISNTPSIFSRTSSFQNLNTRNFSLSRYFVRSASYSVASACCPPSISIANLRSRQTKSTMKGPISCCLRKLKPSIFRRRIGNSTPPPRG